MRMSARGLVDRASDSDSEDRGFESRRARAKKSPKTGMFGGFCCPKENPRFERGFQPVKKRSLFAAFSDILEKA